MWPREAIWGRGSRRDVAPLPSLKTICVFDANGQRLRTHACMKPNYRKRNEAGLVSDTSQIE
jgi:hypothetical protein